jgi:hypothetical protein
MPTNGGGAYGVAPVAGVVGVFTEANSDSRAGGAFAVRDDGGTYNWVYIAGQQSGNVRKIHGAGTASTNIRDLRSGRYHTLFCPEAPEALFWDQGDLLLTSQKAFIPFDPLLAQHILPPYSVYLQPWGPIQVSVNQITPEGFFVETEKAPPHPLRGLLPPPDSQQVRRRTPARSQPPSLLYAFPAGYHLPQPAAASQKPQKHEITYAVARNTQYAP